MKRRAKIVAGILIMSMIVSLLTPSMGVVRAEEASADINGLSVEGEDMMEMNEEADEGAELVTAQAETSGTCGAMVNMSPFLICFWERLPVTSVLLKYSVKPRVSRLFNQFDNLSFTDSGL